MEMIMNSFRPIHLLMIFIVLVSGCSTAHLTGSWKSPEYVKTIDHVYIVGIAKNAVSRRLFEDEFEKKLRTAGVTGHVSYQDFASDPETDKDIVIEKARQKGADSILLTRMIRKRTETVVSPGRVTGYETGPAYYYPSPYYRSYNTYYTRRYETIYEPPKVAQYQIATVESNLYDTTTKELIWSAQLETTVEGSLQKMIDDYIDVVIRDMKEKALF